MVVPLAILNDKVGETIRLWLVNGAILATVNLVTIKDFLSIGLLSVSICYTVWQWRRSIFAACERCREGNLPRFCRLPVSRRPWWCPKKV